MIRLRHPAKVPHLMQGDRQQVLGRIREALTISAPRHYESSPKLSAPAISAAFRKWLPPGGATLQEQRALFARQSEVLRTELRECADEVEAAACLQSLATTAAWQRLAFHPGELVDPVLKHLEPEFDLLNVESGYDKSALESCNAALTECESLIAQTGSVCVTGRSSGGRALSVLPPHHIVLARQSQLVPDLTAAFELLARKYGAAYPSFISFISGPSRTGDIERILVLGAHGPKKLTILLLP